MSAMQRRKGQSGEQELFSLLSDLLGTCVRRNVDQARAGGADGLDVPGWAIEVKRQEGGFKAAWWDQAVQQGGDSGRRPALAYRASRQPWRVRLYLHDVDCEWTAGPAWVETDLQTFAMIVRETLSINARVFNEFTFDMERRPD